MKKSGPGVGQVRGVIGSGFGKDSLAGADRAGCWDGR